MLLSGVNMWEYSTCTSFLWLFFFLYIILTYVLTLYLLLTRCLHYINLYYLQYIYYNTITLFFGYDLLHSRQTSVAGNIVSKDVISVSIAFHSVSYVRKKYIYKPRGAIFLEVLISSNPVIYLTLKHSEKGLWLIKRQPWRFPFECGLRRI